MTTQWTYFAADGSYGDAADMVIVNTTQWGDKDWAEMANLPDTERFQSAEMLGWQYEDYMIPVSEHTILNTNGTCERCANITDDEVVRSYDTGVVKR